MRSSTHLEVSFNLNIKWWRISRQETISNEIFKVPGEFGD
jgi:hypothetical protein